MALSETPNSKTAWGDIHLSLGPTGVGDAMSSTLADLGIIDADNLTITTAAGEVYTLKDINGKIYDQLRLEPEIEVGVSILKPSEATRGKFWKLEEEGTGDARKLHVKSLVTNDDYSIVLSNPKAVGSETFEAPKCKINMDLTYSKDKGFGGTCSFKIVMGATGDLFSFGVVPTPAG